MNKTEKVRKPWYKKIWVWTIVGFVALLVSLTICASKESTLPLEPTVETTSEPVETESLLPTNTEESSLNEEQVTEQTATTMPEQETIGETEVPEQDIVYETEEPEQDATSETEENITSETEETEPTNETTVDYGTDYVLNTNSKKFHYPHCSSAERIKDSNRLDYHGTRDELINMGYDPCGRCKP